MTNPIPEPARDTKTEYLFDATCFGVPANPQRAEDVADGIALAIKLDEHPVFLGGLADRLTQLGTACTIGDTEIMLTEVKHRYKELLGKSCPRTVQEWVKGKMPGITSRLNHYELCYALEMDHQQTAVFFRKHFLTMPYNVKSKEDAVFLYCLYHLKPYTTAAKMLADASGFVNQENAHTATSQIMTTIMQTDDDAAFLRYLSAHCYGNKQQFQLARQIVNREIDLLKETLKKEAELGMTELLSPERLNSRTVAELLGYSYQGSEKAVPVHQLPKRFTESLPKDVTLGKIINSEDVSYETLRKTMLLLHFYNFYHDAEQTDRYTIGGNLIDFYEEMDNLLLSCGFAQIYVRHPFDCLLLYCANSYDPILTLHYLNERN